MLNIAKLTEEEKEELERLKHTRKKRLEYRRNHKEQENKATIEYFKKLKSMTIDERIDYELNKQYKKERYTMYKYFQPKEYKIENKEIKAYHEKINREKKK